MRGEVAGPSAATQEGKIHHRDQALPEVLPGRGVSTRYDDFIGFGICVILFISDFDGFLYKSLVIFFLLILQHCSGVTYLLK